MVHGTSLYPSGVRGTRTMPVGLSGAFGRRVGAVVSDFPI